MAENLDRQLLFGVLALQNELINEGQMMAAVREWLTNKEVPLVDILIRNQALRTEQRDPLEQMVQRHIEEHEDNPTISLAATAAYDTIGEQLENLEDEDIDRTLEDVAATIASSELSSLGMEGSTASGSPSRLGERFRVLRPHRGGGLGFVSIAEDEEIRREVALKQIRGKYADEPLFRRRFRVEAEITGGLEHPNIVPVYGLGADMTGRPFYAMRFIRGASLKDAIKDYYADSEQTVWDPQRGEGPSLSLAERRRYRFRRLLEKFIDVCEAMHYAHSRGVLHRDLKPGNVMLGRYGEVLVVDWGLAISRTREDELKGESEEDTLIPRSGSEDTEAKEGVCEGTPQYMAPEQAAGRAKRLGPHTDVYALGATLYCILTGKPPFASESDVGTTLSKVQVGDFLPPRALVPDVSPALEAICLKAMATKIENRYATCELLAADIQRWLDDQPVTAWKEPWTVRAGRWVRQHQKTVTGLLAALAVGLIAAVIIGLVTYYLKEEALANYRVARQAVDQFYTEVAEEGLLSQPGQEQKRQELLDSAKQAYSQFVEKYGGEAHDEAARTRYRLGVITKELGDQDEAVKLLEQALAEQNTLLTEAATKERKFDLANTYNQLGIVFTAKGQTPEAADALKKALALRQDIAKTQPNARLQRKLANTLMNLGVVLRKQGKLSESIQRFSESMAIREQYPFDDYEWQRDRAKGLLNRVLSISDRIGGKDPLTPAAIAGLKEEAERDGQSAIKILHQLAAGVVNTEVLNLENGARLYLNRLYDLTNDDAARRLLLSQFIDNARALQTASPDVPEYRANLARYLTQLGDIAYGEQDWPQVRELYAEALTQWDAIPDREKTPIYSRDHALCLKVLGKIDDREDKIAAAVEHATSAEEELQALVTKFPDKADYQEALQDVQSFRLKVLAKAARIDGDMALARQRGQEALAQLEVFWQNKPNSPDRTYQVEDCRRLLESLSLEP